MRLLTRVVQTLGLSVLVAGSCGWWYYVSAQDLSDAPIHTDFCALVKNPSEFNGKTVIVRARLTELRSGESALDGVCFQPVLLALPVNVVPRPDFDLKVSPAVEALFNAQREKRVLFRADFIGRFDLSSGQPAKTFGKARLRMRLVLREVANPERIVIPGR